MVGSCVIPCCPNCYSPQRNVSYFRFPNPSKYPELHQAWLTAIKIPNIPDFKPSRHSSICELHFNEEDYDETYRMKRNLMPSDYFRPILKQDALPKLEIQSGSDLKKNGENVQIMRELLGDSYLKWKGGAPSIKKELQEEDFTPITVKMKNFGCEKGECKRLQVVKKVKKECVEMKKEETNEDSDITINFLMKQPLKPLPAELARIIPSILSVIIKEVPTDRNEKLKIPTQNPDEFSCWSLLSVKNFHCCQHCDFSTFLKINLINHMRSTHRPIRTSEVTRLPMKIYKHREPPKYSCPTCDFFTFSRLVLLRHAHKTKEYYLLSQIEVKWFNCEYCAYRSRKDIRLKAHIINKHSSVKKDDEYKCKYCCYSGDRERNLKRHLERQHSQKQWQCHMCSFKSYNQGNLRVHMGAKHFRTNQKYQCAKCEYNTKNGHLMERHMVARHTQAGHITWYQCEKCQFQTKYRDSFRNHLMKKHGDKDFL